QITSLDDFALIVVITDDLESVRAWAEQIAPVTDTSIVFATGYVASPLAAPYVASTGLNALLVGFRDAYTYSRLLDALSVSGVLPLIVTAQPTSIPTEILATDQPATSEPTMNSTEADSTEEATTAPSEATQATEEATGAQDQSTETTPAATTPAGTEAATQASEGTTTNSPITPEASVIGVINAEQPVNVREGPGRGFAVVGVAQPGDVVEVLDQNDDKSWYKIRLEDDREGWISASLVEITSASLPDIGLVMNIGLGSGFIMMAQGSSDTTTPDPAVTLATETPTPTATMTSTPTATFTPTLTPTPLPVSGKSASIPYQEERWYGMTLGTIMIIVIIIAGNVLSLIRRASLRRTRRVNSGRGR
ncbi:MAG TPA: SH3 domain-containing protein, partial [Phototrophicaceae bacterium]|nr:SH3 domain-containing protein [Phototrophicaceae bacterium]